LHALPLHDALPTGPRSPRSHHCPRNRRRTDMRRLPLIILLLLAGCGGGPVTQPPPPSVLEAREMHRQALDAYQSGRYPAALAMFEEAEKLFRSIDDPHGIASARSEEHTSELQSRD